MTANTIHDTSQGKVSFFPFRIPISVVYDDFQTVAMPTSHLENF